MVLEHDPNGQEQQQQQQHPLQENPPASPTDPITHPTGLSANPSAFTTTDGTHQTHLPRIRIAAAVPSVSSPNTPPSAPVVPSRVPPLPPVKHHMVTRTSTGHIRMTARWIYKLKRDSAGRVTRCRACLVAKGMADCKGVSTPLAVSSLGSASPLASSFSDPTRYRQDCHWDVVKRILSYLQPTKDLDRLSTGGHAVYFGSNLVSWKQRIVSRSSTEAEYKSPADCASEMMWMLSLFRELGGSLVSPHVLWCDNIGATYLAANPVYHPHTKHTQIDYDFVREKIASNQLQILFVSTKDHITDIFTKALPIKSFSFFHDKLQVGVPLLGLGGGGGRDIIVDTCLDYALL
ncbi:hypothetical protein LIER_00096 [Lithospermum erythrorhizon]|uniref:Uncharacterized protein n=1 Tax=Lithospermum erythrorhizon TaxID=34254 RepID=A0AAV3NKP2_LITER